MPAPSRPPVDGGPAGTHPERGTPAAGLVGVSGAGAHQLVPQTVVDVEPPDLGQLDPGLLR